MKILDTIRLTDNQKRVIAKIVASPTPKVAGEEISDNVNLVSARNTLQRLGLINVNPMSGEASLTPRGEQFAKDEYVVDETGSLTPAGEKLATTMPSGQPDQTTTSQRQPPQPEMPVSAQPPAVPESVSLKSLLHIK